MCDLRDPKRCRKLNGEESSEVLMHLFTHLKAGAALGNLAWWHIRAISGVEMGPRAGIVDIRELCAVLCCRHDGKDALRRVCLDHLTDIAYQGSALHLHPAISRDHTPRTRGSQPRLSCVPQSTSSVLRRCSWATPPRGDLKTPSTPDMYSLVCSCARAAQRSSTTRLPQGMCTCTR